MPTLELPELDSLPVAEAPQGDSFPDSAAATRDPSTPLHTDLDGDPDLPSTIADKTPSGQSQPLLLISDDDPNQRLLIRHVMGKEGYRVIEASDGESCLEAFATHLPDMVLLDAVMPQLDGFECCRRLHAQNPDLPILMVTALDDEASVAKAFAAGATDYIPKPIYWPVLKRRIRHLLEASRAHRHLQELNQALEEKVKERTAQLACQVEDLQHLHRLKDDFLATVSHELRTPLTKVELALQLLGRTPLNEKQQQYHRIALEECHAEINLIDKLLDLQRLENEELAASVSAIDLNGLWVSLLGSVQERAQARHLTLQAADPPPAAVIHTHRQHLSQILQELLENACKFTQPGGTLRLEAQPMPGGFEFRVGNTAQIPAAELPRLFDRFYRVPSADPWAQQGSGLGLALVKQWVEYLQGQIRVTSQAGWTWFILRLPDLKLPNPNA
ncbi:MAG: response regulator [Cyanobacteriota bacterium]